MNLERITEPVTSRVKEAYDTVTHPFHAAALKDDLKEVERLHAEPGHSIDMCDDNGCNALHVAAHYDSASVVEFLCKNGVNIFQKDNDGSDGLTPVSYAIMSDSISVIKEIFSLASRFSNYRLRDVFQNDYRGRSPFQLAVICESPKVLEELINVNDAIPKHDRLSNQDIQIIGDPFNLLQVAAIRDSAKCAEILIKNGVDFRSTGNDSRGRMPIDLANEYGHKQVRNVLIGALRQASRKKLRSANILDFIRIKFKMNMIEVLGDQYLDTKEASEHTGKTIPEINKWLEDDDNSSARRLSFWKTLPWWASSMVASSIKWIWFIFIGVFLVWYANGFRDWVHDNFLSCITGCT